MNKTSKEAIEGILRSCIDRTLERTKEAKTFRPFHEALLTKELIAASAFERSFSTSFGQGPIEEISQILALADGAESVRQKEVRVDITKGAEDEITRILKALRDGDGKPDWKKEIDRVLALKKGDHIQVRILSDLWIKKDNKEAFISIKTVKPNIDQAEKAKHDMLMLKAHNPDYVTYFGLYYNPGGPKREDYNWSIPGKIFDMKKDECVLIGQEYWDTIGGKETYKNLLEVFEKIGNETREKLKSMSH
jgi:hypothetical protein